MDKLSKEDEEKARKLIRQAGISFAGIIVQWEGDEGLQYGVVPSNIEKSVSDFVFLDKIRRDKKTIVYSRKGDKILKQIVLVEKLKIIGFNN